MSDVNGPFLYDDRPDPLHTGQGRRRTGLLIALLAGTVVVAVAMVGLMGVFKGSAQDQAKEVATVFTAALSQGDTDTAYDLVCDEVRAVVPRERLADEYLQPGTLKVLGSHGDQVDGSPVQYVQVRWDDGGSVVETELTVVPEGGTEARAPRPADCARRPWCPAGRRGRLGAPPSGPTGVPAVGDG